MGIGETPAIPDTGKCRLCEQKGNTLCEYCRIIVASNLIKRRGYYKSRSYIKIPSIEHKGIRKRELKQDIKFYQKCLKNENDLFCWVEYYNAKKEAHESVFTVAALLYVATLFLLVIVEPSSAVNNIETAQFNVFWIGLISILIYTIYCARWEVEIKLAEFAQHRDSNEFNARLKSSHNALAQITDRYETYILENAGFVENLNLKIPETMPNKSSLVYPGVLRLNLEHPPHKKCRYCKEELDFVWTNGIFHESCLPISSRTAACGNCGYQNCNGCGDEF